MFNRNAILSITWLFLVTASTAYCGIFSTTPSKSKSDLNINFQNDSRSTMSNSQSSSGSLKGDRQMEDQIKDLIENKFSKYNINVRAYQGNVTLKGNVQDEATRQNIVNAVSKISGVKTVNNSLTIQ